jgi:hypothetical protein
MRSVARDNRRRYVNAFLVIWIAVLAIDAFRPINGAHRWLEDRVIDYPLDITGLWQGPWSLFREVPRDNLRLSARIEFADGATATWSSPDWARIAAPGKFVRAREMNYFRNILHAGQEPAWDGLAAYLARTVPHPQGAAAPATTVTLLLSGATIPPPEQGLVPALPYTRFDPPNPIWVWRRK